MRLAATIISIFTLLLCSCALEPKSKVDSRIELNKLKGPEVGSIDTTLHDQAQQAEKSGDFKQASQLYKQLVDKSPDKTEYTLALIDNLRRAGDSQDALKFIDSLLKKEPDNAQALEAKGLCLMNIGDFAEASKAFGEVMKIDGKRWRTLNGIGILFAVKNMQTDALAYYQEALNQSPDNPSVLNNVGLTLAMDRQFDRAIEALERGKHHLPNGSPEVRRIDLNLALVYAIAGKLDEAQQTAAPHLSKAGLYNNMGFYEYLAKNNDLAKGYLNMALTQSTTYYERAWKNLSALNAEGTGEPNTNNSDSLSKNAAPQQKEKIQSDVKPPKHSAGIPLEQIPESPSKVTTVKDNEEEVTPAPVKEVKKKSKDKEKSSKDKLLTLPSESGETKPEIEKAETKPKPVKKKKLVKVEEKKEIKPEAVETPVVAPAPAVQPDAPSVVSPKADVPAAPVTNALPFVKIEPPKPNNSKPADDKPVSQPSQVLIVPSDKNSESKLKIESQKDDKSDAPPSSAPNMPSDKVPDR